MRGMAVAHVQSQNNTTRQRVPSKTYEEGKVSTRDVTFFRWILKASVRGSFSVEFELETGGCKNITPSRYWRLVVIFLQPPVSNCLFIYVNFWRETQSQPLTGAN